jgi:hypothetical protein
VAQGSSNPSVVSESPQDPLILKELRLELLDGEVSAEHLVASEKYPTEVPFAKGSPYDIAIEEEVSVLAMYGHAACFLQLTIELSCRGRLQNR